MVSVARPPHRAIVCVRSVVAQKGTVSPATAISPMPASATSSPSMPITCEGKYFNA